MTMALSLRVLAPVLVTGACLVACAAEPASSNEAASTDIAPIVHPKVHVVEGEPGKELDVQPDSVAASVAQFGAIATYVPGDVIVSGRAAGFLRRVRATRVEGDRVVVDTEPASLEDVFQQVHLRGSLAEPPPAPATAGLAPRGVFLKLPAMQIANTRVPVGDGSEIEIVEGSFSMQPKLDFDMKMRGGKLDHLQVVASGTTHTKLHVRYDLHHVAGQSGSVRRSDGIPVADSPPYYAVFWAGVVPVVVAVRARLLAGFKLNVSGEVSGEESVSANGSVTAGLEYENGGWRNVASNGVSIRAEGPPTVVSHHISGDVTLTARLDVSFYDVAGPYVGVQAYTGVGHEGSDDLSGWFAEIGLRGIAGAQVSVFGKRVAAYETVLFDVHDQHPF
jgi:hypothetical protein